MEIDPSDSPHIKTDPLRGEVFEGPDGVRQKKVIYLNFRTLKTASKWANI